MRILAADLDNDAAYKLMTGIVVPRPIAWVTTLSPDGIVNLAPFSAFTFVSTDPPMLGFNVGRRDGAVKDTARNIGANGEFVVHIADETLMEPLHLSADDFPPEIGEAAALGLAVEPSTMVAVPRLAAAPIAMECVFSQSVHFGRAGAEFFVGEVRIFHIRDGLCTHGKVDTAALRPLARLAGPSYGGIGGIRHVRPNRPVTAAEPL
ncbi:MAG: flavin reductase family protein [Alphaproteobacteria bacterium]|nr:flavin reductase family protein [Alphaproteobacteria bacterium]